MEEMQNTNEWVQANTNTTGSEVVMNTTSNVANDESPLGKLMGALGDLLLNNDDFTYQMVRQSCDYVTDNVDLSDFNTESLIDSLHTDIKDSVLDEIDYSRITDDVLDNINYRDIARVVVDDYIDISDIGERASEYVDGMSIAYDLLGQYNPRAICSTGEAFTRAIKLAIEYLVETDDSVISRIGNYDATVSNMTDEQVQEEYIANESNIAETALAAQQVSDDFIYNLIKRIVNELIYQYVPSFNTDAFMRIRMEAKAFDIYNNMKEG